MQRWHYSIDGRERIGPVSTNALASALAVCDGPGSVMVWRPGLDDWLPAAEIPGLLRAVEIKRRPPPLPGADPCGEEDAGAGAEGESPRPASGPGEAVYDTPMVGGPVAPRDGARSEPPPRGDGRSHPWEALEVGPTPGGGRSRAPST